ncbi:MAG: hypothetical protein M1816_001295 [Peltula sp. TS41687]|nr:MAG: hypothetical protein M1816_001295 [Peltula sp. TS41687]
MAFPLSHTRPNGQIGGPGEIGHNNNNQQQDWASQLRGEERNMYERLRETHARWKSTDRELWESLQECQSQIPADAEPSQHLWLLHQCTMDVMSLAVQRTGRNIARLSEELKRMPFREDRQEKSVLDSWLQESTSEKKGDESQDDSQVNHGKANAGNSLFSKLKLHLNIPPGDPFSKVKPNPSSSLFPVKFLPPGGLGPLLYVP